MFAHTSEFPLLEGPPTHAPGRVQPTRQWIAGAAVAIAFAVGASWTVRPLVTTAERPTASSALPSAAYTSLGRRRSHNGRYSAEVVHTTPLVVGANESWTVHLTRRSRERVAHAKVSVQPWMPETAERGPAVTARYLGHGDYRVDGLVLSRPGWWNVALVIGGRAGTDSVAFNVILPPVRRSAPDVGSH